MGIISRFRSRVSKVYTSVDRKVFKGALPSGAPKETEKAPTTSTPTKTPPPVSRTDARPRSTTRVATPAEVKELETFGTKEAKGTSVTIKPSGEKVYRRNGQAVATFTPQTTTEARPSGVISKYQPTLLISSEEARAGRRTPSARSVVTQSAYALGLPIDKPGHAVTGKEFASVLSLAVPYTAGRIAGRALTLARPGLRMAGQTALAGTAVVAGGVEAVKLAGTPKEQRLATLGYDVLRVAPEALSFGAGYSRSVKNIGATVAKGTEFIKVKETVAVRGGEILAKQIPSKTPATYETLYKVEYKLPKSFKHIEATLPKSAKIKYEVSRVYETAPEYTGLNILAPTGRGTITPETTFYTPPKTTFFTGRLKGKPTPETKVLGKPKDILLPAIPRKTLPFYDTKFIDLTGSRILPYGRGDYKFKSQFKPKVYLGEKGYIVKKVDKQTARIFDYDLPTGAIVSKPLVSKPTKLRGLRDIKKVSEPLDVFGVGLTTPGIYKTTTYTIPKPITKPGRIRTELLPAEVLGKPTARFKLKTRPTTTVLSTTRTGLKNVTDVLTSTKVSTKLVTDVTTKVRTDTRVRTDLLTDVVTDIPPPKTPLPPPPIPPIIFGFGYLPLGATGRRRRRRARKGSKAMGRFTRSFTANVLGIKAPRKRKVKRRYTGFELRT